MSDVPLPTVLISDRQGDPVPLDALAALAHTVLVGEDAGACELSLSFVEPAEIEDLHVRYMDEPGPTDVLSFPQEDTVEDGAGVQFRVLGDVIVCPKVAAANHPDDPEAEVRLLVVHGVLHLLGHDHEGEDERARMWAIQERYSGVRVP